MYRARNLEPEKEEEDFLEWSERGEGNHVPKSILRQQQELEMKEGRGRQLPLHYEATPARSTRASRRILCVSISLAAPIIFQSRFPGLRPAGHNRNL